jgi:hypothetical protein
MFALRSGEEILPSSGIECLLLELITSMYRLRNLGPRRARGNSLFLIWFAEYIKNANVSLQLASFLLKKSLRKIFAEQILRVGGGS